MPKPRRQRLTQTEVDDRPIAIQRASIGLSTPSASERQAVWSRVSVPSAGIFAEQGGYRPHRLVGQAHNHPARAVLLAGGNRVGKSLAAAMEATVWAPHSDLIWLAGNSYDLARQEIEYLAEALTSLGWVHPSGIHIPSLRYNPASIDTVWGTTIETRSLHDVNTFVMRAPDLVVICEPGQAPRESLAKARERLSTKRGRLWLAGTFENVTSSWYEDAWRRWVRWPNSESGKSFSIPTWLNTYSFPGGKHDPEITAMKNTYASFNEFLLRVAGVPVPSEALVIGEYWNPKRNILDGMEFVATNRDGTIIPVELAIDPGFSGGSHYIVEAVQVIDGRVCLIDEVAVQSLVHEEVIQECQRRPWWRSVTGGVIDPYAGGSHIFGAQSPMDVWFKQTRVPLRMAPRWSVEDSVSRLCHELRSPDNSQPNLYVSPNCTRFIWEMTHWRKRKTREGFAGPSPNHCDASKAVSYWLAERYNRLQTGGVDVPIIRPFTWG